MKYINKSYNIAHLFSIYAIFGPLLVLGFFITTMTESPLKNIFEIYRSLLTGFALLPFPLLGISVQISHAFSKTMFKCLSKALTLANNFLLFLQFMRIYELDLTALVNMASGPSLNVSSWGVCLSSASLFYYVYSIFFIILNINYNKIKLFC